MPLKGCGLAHAFQETGIYAHVYRGTLGLCTHTHIYIYIYIHIYRYIHIYIYDIIYTIIYILSFISSDPCVGAGEKELREVPLKGCGLAHAPEEAARRCFALNTPQVSLPSSPPQVFFLYKPRATILGKTNPALPIVWVCSSRAKRVHM